MQRMPPFECMADLQKDNFSSSGSDFSDDSDYSTDGSQESNASDDTCSTVAIINENKENQRSSTPIQAVSPRTYELRPRKAITYTKNGIIDESVHDFINQIKVSEKVSKTKRVEQQFINFFSSEED